MKNHTQTDTAGAQIPLEPKRQAVVVLGMHRSGTSALTGSLNVLGCNVPIKPIKHAAQNPKGFFEATAIARMNDALLNTAGQTWDRWHPLPQGWMDTPEVTALLPASQDVLMEEFGTPPILALKDPRICRVLPFWLQVLEQQNTQPLILLIHRNPMEVAQSLQKRNGFDLAHGLMLWLSYVLDAERNSRKAKRSFISFSQLLDDPVQQMRRVLAELGAHVPYNPSQLAPKTSDFISPELRHHTVQTPALMPTLHQYVFDILEQWANKGENTEDHARLDQVWRLFSAFGNTISASPDLDATHSDLIYKALFQITPDQPASLPSLPKSSGAHVAQTMAALTLSLNQELSFAETCHTQAVDRLKGTVKDLKAQKHSLQTSVDDLRLDLSHQIQTISRLNNAIAALGHEADALCQEKNVLENTMRDMQEQRIKAQQDWAVTERARRALERKVSSMTREQTELTQLTSYMEAERQAILSSTSWRLTRLVRWIGKRLGRDGPPNSSDTP